MNFKSLVIIGQTASGKTNLAHKIFDELKYHNITCELVNTDAFQIYKHLSIGTAKPSAFEQQQYHYHGIDLCEPHESMDANVFAKFLHQTCQKIYNAGKLPICVGGSGLYLRAFLHGLDQFPSHDPQIRQNIRDYAKENGWEKCYERLQNVDPIRASELHPNDHVRIERALEIYEVTKIPPSQIQTKRSPLYTQDYLFDAFVIETDVDSSILKENISARTKLLLQAGWVSEVQNLYKTYGFELKNFNSMRAIGYSTILNSILEPNLTDSDILEKISTETRQYAKRQKTWNKKESKQIVINTIECENFEKVIQDIKGWF